MEGGSQNEHLLLAINIFRLTHPDVQDVDKVRLSEQVLSSIKSDFMASLYETLASNGVFKLDQSLLDSMRQNIDEEIKKLDEKIADAEENLGENEVREAHLAKSLYLIRIGDKDKALEQLKVTETKTVAVGQKMDLVFYTLQVALFDMDFDLISKSLDKAKNLFKEGGDWERKNRLKVYEGLYCIATRNFKKAASLFLDSISTFTTYELFPYDTFTFYTVLTSVISLDRVSLKQMVGDAPEILIVIGKIPYLYEFLSSLYDCRYKSFFSAFDKRTNRRRVSNMATATHKEEETQLLQKVSDTISAIIDAKFVDDVILALHSLALLFFPIDTSTLSGVISEKYRNKFNQVEVSSSSERRNQLWEVFYRGVSFPTLARFLIYDVASNWLSCFPLTARILVYDVFFVKGLITEVVQALVPFLDHNANAVRSNAERLVELCLLENEGALQLTREIDLYHESEDGSGSLVKLTVSRVAQLVASVPDKARLGAPKSLSSYLFFKSITIQLLDGTEEKNSKLYSEEVLPGVVVVDGNFQFVAEMFARICRRGSADLLVKELIPRVRRCLQNFSLSHKDTITENTLKSDSSFGFWFLMIEIIKDTYVVEKMTEQFLHQLIAECSNAKEAYWILWIVFHRSFQHQPTVRVMFIEKLLLVKVFPLRGLRWILQFAVFGCPPDDNKLKKGDENRALLETVQRVVQVWSKREFVQSAPLEQQLYVTAVAGLLLENMSREELDSTKDVMRSILEGVSCRLENPDDLVRRMASNIALVFSKVVDPKNPLYLDDSCREENVDWEFGLASSNGASNTKGSSCNNLKNTETCDNILLRAEVSHGDTHETGSKLDPRKKESFRYKLIDPDEIVDPASLNNELLYGDEVDDDASEDSEASSDSSLQPYDLTDDDTDLKKRISQLVDVVGALRKSDDADGVENALDVAEKLVRASPEELRHVASELVRTLVQARCADSVLEGEEETAEEKRQKALVALLVMCPFESLNTITKLLYSPHLDVSQRIMILDVMTEAAYELANAKTIVQKSQSKPLIASLSETQPWFLPSSKGPPGARSWKEVPDTLPFSPLNLTQRFERVLPSKAGEIKGKTRRLGHKLQNIQTTDIDWSQNKFPLHAAAFMLPAMQGFDKKSHGVDLLGRDFLVLGKLIYMLGVCIKCTSLHPEASVLAPPLLDMLSSREVCHHKEAFVRRSVLFAASCTLTALHPSFIASALIEGNEEVSRGLEWIRTWALQIAESDTDRECYTMAMACLQLHAEMSLQASRALESSESSLQKKSIGLPSNLSKGVVRIRGSNNLFLD